MTQEKDEIHEAGRACMMFVMDCLKQANYGNITPWVDGTDPFERRIRKCLEGRPNRTALLFFHIAMWFAENQPGTPVPEWCILNWPIRQEDVDEAITAYEKDTGRKIEDSPQLPSGDWGTWVFRGK